MKTKSFKWAFLVAFMCAVPLLSCCHDKYWREKHIKQKEETLLVGIPFIRHSLRTPSTDPATKVESVLFAFFEGNESASTLVKVLDSSNPEEIATGKFRLKLTKANYSLLVVANPNEEMRKLLVPGITLDKLNEPFPTEHFFSANFDPDTKKIKDIFPIALLNAQGLVPVKEEHFGKDPSSSLSVELELSFARLVATGYPSFPASIKDLLGKYAILASVNFRKAYLMRKMALLSSGQQEQLGDGSTVHERYAYSPLYKEFERVTTEEDFRPFITSRYISISTILPEEKNWIAKNADINTKRNYLGAYRLEHTVSPKNLLTALSPHLTLVYKICPSTLSPTEGEGWISYQKRFFMLESDFREVLLALQSGTTVNVEAAKQFPTSFLIASKKLLSDAGNDPSKVLKLSFTKEDIRFYKKCHNYYFFPIRHFDDTQAPNHNSYGRYGIVRGNEYLFRTPQEIKEFGFTGLDQIGNDFSPLRETEAMEALIKVSAINTRDEQVLTY